MFAREWLVCAIDEVHAARKVNQFYMAAFQLRVRSRIPIAITATPIVTGLMASRLLVVSLPWAKYVLLRTCGTSAVSSGYVNSFRRYNSQP